MPQRIFSCLDRGCMVLDRVLQGIFALRTHHTPAQGRPYPATEVQDAPDFSAADKRVSAALMRINHAGEVCAQALYHGQAIFARLPAVQAQLQQAALEEGDHLHWCATRIQTLGGRTSYLDPFWYIGAFGIGMCVSAISDGVSLGFMAETEQQVSAHLARHLQRLPQADHASRVILAQMLVDESAHASAAHANGAIALPTWATTLMHAASTVMVKTAYWL